MKLEIEVEREDDGRWIAEVPSLPGVMAYGATEPQVWAKAEALALRVLADRLEHQGDDPDLMTISFTAARARRGRGPTRRVAIDSGRGPGVASIMHHSERITIDPGRRSGRPCIRGLRMSVSDVLEYLASGMTEEEILAEFPDLELEDLRACLAFAAERAGRA